jgi:hypothetical protein
MCPRCSNAPSPLGTYKRKHRRVGAVEPTSSAPARFSIRYAQSPALITPVSPASKTAATETPALKGRPLKAGAGIILMDAVLPLKEGLQLLIPAITPRKAVSGFWQVISSLKALILMELSEPDGIETVEG